jgi:hypothetical protein
MQGTVQKTRNTTPIFPTYLLNINTCYKKQIKDLTNDILPFQNALKRFLLPNSFYNSKEYFNYRRRSIVI